MDQELFLDVVGAGQLVVSTSAHARCGGRVGFSLSVSWGIHGFTGGVLPREEAKKLLNMLSEQLSDIEESEEDEYKRRSEANLKLAAELDARNSNKH